MVEENEYGQKLGKKLTDWQPRELPKKTLLKGRYCHLEPIDVKHSQDLFEAWYCIDDDRDWTYFHINRPKTLFQTEHYLNVSRIEGNAVNLLMTILICSH